MSIDVIIGIDPGQSGGIAVVDAENNLLSYVKMAATDQDLWHIFDSIFMSMTNRGDGGIHAFLERVHAFPGQGVVSTWKFAEHYGKLKAFLVASEFPFELVSSTVWQRKMGCLTKGDKNITKAKAQELYPKAKVTHAVADAMLIATYGRRVLHERGDL